MTKRTLQRYSPEEENIILQAVQDNPNDLRLAYKKAEKALKGRKAVHIRLKHLYMLGKKSTPKKITTEINFIDLFDHLLPVTKNKTQVEILVNLFKRIR